MSVIEMILAIEGTIAVPIIGYVVTYINKMKEDINQLKVDIEKAKAEAKEATFENERHILGCANFQPKHNV